jgi:GNAT superfamily N-acetyltransferase
MSIRMVETEEDLLRCFALMAELRMNLTQSIFIERVHSLMQKHGYRLVILEDEGKIKALAGFRIAETLARGTFLKIDDFVIHNRFQGMGFGSRLFQWLLQYAREQNCDQVHVDPGAQWRDSYRFYLRNGMQINGYHFMRKLG